MLAPVDTLRQIQGAALERLGFGPAECGYRIVEKDSVDAAPDLPTEVVPLDPAAAALRREMALT